METSQEGFWAPHDHDHDHCSPLLQIQTEMLLSQNCPSLESKALVKETCFHLSSEKTAKTCAPAHFLQADFRTKTISRFCGSGAQKSLIQKEQPGGCQHTVYKPPDQLAFITTNA